MWKLFHRLLDYFGTVEEDRDLLLYGSPRSGQWQTVRKKFLKRYYYCAVCSGQDDLEVHHIIPYQLRPELELDENNLITLCMAPTRKCHLIFGHLGDWKSYNPEVVADSKLFSNKIKSRPYIVKEEPCTMILPL